MEGVYTKAEIAEQYDELIKRMKDLLQSQDDSMFSVSKNDKWSTGQQIEHLIKSAKAVNKGLGINKLVLRGMFGLNNRDEKSFNQLQDKFTNGIKTVGKIELPDYAPKHVENHQKEEMVKKLALELKTISNHVESWKEENLTKYILPHPMLGKLTIREMAYFTIIHTNHHLNSITEQYS